ncbi:MAG TPA: enolase C-terminal domain-like protein [Micropepsaceae bacterium]|nr:enolase C-terminal domain-like protein [Micropepsaceae bacterium]
MPAKSRSLLRRTQSAKSSDHALTGPKIGAVKASAYKIPTDAPESDGTLEWDSTTLVLAEISAGGKTGIGYSYASDAAAGIITGKLAKHLEGADAFSIPAAWEAMVGAVRNLGWRGVCANAISAADIALWDLKAKLLALPVSELIGRAQDRVEVYGSGGFTSYDNRRLAEQLGGWAHEDGCRAVKMKIGREPDKDLTRIRAAHKAIGKAQLFVDANGAYSRKQALEFACAFAEFGIGWFEEPVSSDDLEGLRLLRDRAPPVMDVAAGEYGYDQFYFRRMLEAGAVDVLQIDATRACGYTGFLMGAAIARSFSLPISSHCAPAIHLPVAASCAHLKNMEWFHDHVRIEHMLFDGAPDIRDGFVLPDFQRSGHGLEFRRAAAEKYRV